MAIGCGAKCAKIILIIYNILFLLTGLFLIGLGIWLLVDGRVQNLVNLSYNGLSSTYFRDAAILLITMGCVILFIAALGFFGAITENGICLGIYIGFLVVIFCGEIAGGVLAIVFKDQIIYNLDNALMNTLENSLNPSTPTTQQYYYTVNTTTPNTCQTSQTGYLWDYGQITFQCCGVATGFDGYFDGNQPYNFQSMCSNLNSPSYPVSCYPLLPGQSFSTFYNTNNMYASQNLVNGTAVVYQQGCYNAVQYWLNKYAPVLIGIGIGFGMLQLYGLIFAVCLCRNMGKEID